MSKNGGALLEYEVMTPNHTVVHVRISGQGRVGIGLSSWEGLSTGRHEKAPVRCQCSRLTTLHGDPRTRLLR